MITAKTIKISGLKSYQEAEKILRQVCPDNGDSVALSLPPAV
jgi:hypothetical protein